MASTAERDEGCWVSYGRRDGLHRLPPPIPSSVGRLARARTSDGHLVISPEKCDAVAHRVSGRKAEGRLVLGLPETDAAATAAPHPLEAAGVYEEEEGGIRRSPLFAVETPVLRTDERARGTSIVRDAHHLLPAA